jgi:phosphomevalonate kinase
MRASVPANLLLLGEYAVLEEGGLGLAVAAEPRAWVRARRRPAGAGLTVIARMDTVLRWEPAEPRGEPRAALLEAAVEVCRQPAPAAGTGQPAGPAGEVSGNIEVDSSGFFLAGRKGGYGSSAAASVALCWALLALAGKAPPQPAAVLEAALATHRLAQGGRGSGYDVLASFHGGVGLFTGGPRPSWRPLQLPWLEPLYLFQGQRSLSTPKAIDRYREWRGRKPLEARRFLEESNRRVEAFTRAASRSQALTCLRRCRELGLRLGAEIGVPADLPPPCQLPAGGLRAQDCKALGAGNELGLAFPERPLEHPAGLRPVQLAAEGWRPEGRPWT